MNIREVIDGDFDDIWPIFHAIVNKGDTYAYLIRNRLKICG